MKFLNSLAVRVGAFAFAAATLLSACTVVVEEPRPGPPPGPRPGFCTREYDPVCARRGGDRQSFNNSCLAEEAGYRIVSAGECRRGGDGGGVVIDRACPKNLDPVCARRGNDTRTFANSCRADEAGFRVISEGECRGDGGGGGGNDQQFCTREYAPVCARRGPDLRTFPNGCEAENTGYRVVSDGPC
jgi:hypothetical protein